MNRARTRDQIAPLNLSRLSVSVYKIDRLVLEDSRLLSRFVPVLLTFPLSVITQLLPSETQRVRHLSLESWEEESEYSFSIPAY